MGLLPQNLWSEMESARYARETQRQAQIAADRGQGNRDPYEVGTGSSGSYFGKPYGGVP